MNDPRNLVVPMMIILIFIVVEIWPIWHVLDGDFIDFLLKPDYLLQSKDIIEGLINDPEGYDNGGRQYIVATAADGSRLISYINNNEIAFNNDRSNSDQSVSNQHDQGNYLENYSPREGQDRDHHLHLGYN